MKKNKPVILYTWCALLVTQGCVDQLDTKLNDYDELLVVEGGIHTGEGPYQIRLFRTSDTQLLIGKQDVFEQSAEVCISDDTGHTDTLKEVGNGWYETTTSMQGEIGRTYTLDIALGNGRSYRSSAEKLPPPVNFLDISTEFETSCEPLNVNQGHRIIAQVENTSADHYFKLEANGVRESFVLAEPGQSCVIQNRCWAVLNGLIANPLVKTNLGVNQPSYPVEVMFLPFDAKGRYFLNVEALALTQGAYQFWKSIEDQGNRSENIFVAPQNTIGGNITRLEDENEPVIGYFSAYSISSSRICIDRTFLQSCVGLPQPTATCSSTCVDIYAPATYDPPHPIEMCAS
ncbi:MAG: DUF4249 domain-containing protein [Cyclobacteriaceae bacterium]|nr:DUF4249 domain-containing protein [Cyclobacteriaceae bacterium HetDA_MAG_MS6]